MLRALNWVKDCGFFECYRWDSSLPDLGRINVLAHELAHLREPHHSPDFWQLLGRVMPDYDERKTELARTGASLWLGATVPYERVESRDY